MVISVVLFTYWWSEPVGTPPHPNLCGRGQGDETQRGDDEWSHHHHPLVQGNSVLPNQISLFIRYKRGSRCWLIAADQWSQIARSWRPVHSLSTVRCIPLIRSTGLFGCEVKVRVSILVTKLIAFKVNFHWTKLWTLPPCYVMAGKMRSYP